MAHLLALPCSPLPPPAPRCFFPSSAPPLPLVSPRSPLPRRSSSLLASAPSLETPQAVAARDCAARAASREIPADASLPRRSFFVCAPVLGACAVGAASGALPAGLLLDAQALAADSATAPAPPQFTDMPAIRGKDYGKTKMKYPDYTETESGLQYKDLREGAGPTPKQGDIVVVDWDGFTIGYYGRIFEARNKAKGGSFEGNEKDFFRFRLGAGEVIPAFEEAVSSMHLGAIRRIIVPPELGYPNNDFNQKGPRPITFSGQRALDFVLKNQGLIDKTLLFDIELLRIVPA